MRISKINLNQNFLKNRYSAQTHNRNQHVKNNNISFLSNIRSCKYPWSPYPAEMEKSISFDKAEKLILEGKNGHSETNAVNVLHVRHLLTGLATIHKHNCHNDDQR